MVLRVPHIVKQSVPFDGTLLVVGLFYMFLEYFTSPTLGDDIIYRFQFSTDPSAPLREVSSLADLWHSQIAHYLIVNGRFPVHFIAQAFLCLLPRWLTIVANSVMYVFVTAESARIISRSGANKVFAAVLFSFFTFVVLKGYQSAFLWSLGAFNYLWPLAINFALYDILSSKRKNIPFPVRIPIIILALLAGWSHEALSLPVCIGIICYWLQYRREPKMRSLLPFFIAYFLGTAFCLLSPGIIHRAGDKATLASHVIGGLVTLFFNVRIGWILLFTAIIAWHRNVLTVDRIKKNAWVIAMLLSAYSIVILSGQTIIRVAVHAEMLALIVMLYLWGTLISQHTWLKLSSIAILVLLILYPFVATACMTQHFNYKNAVEQMRKPGVKVIGTRSLSIKSGIKRWIAETYTMPFAEYGYTCIYMGFDSSDSNMRCAASLVHKPSLIFLPEDVKKKITFSPASYTQPEKDASGKLFVWRVPEGEKIASVGFKLKPENPACLHIWQRFLSYKGDYFQLDDFHWKTVSIGNHYLIFTCPPNNVARRLEKIEIKSTENKTYQLDFH